MNETTAAQRTYFMEVMGDEEEFIEEVLVGCNLCTDRAVTRSLAKAKLWIHDHHDQSPHKDAGTAVDMIGDTPKREASRQLYRSDAEYWAIVAEALENGDGFITAEQAMELTGLSRPSMTMKFNNWTKAQRLVRSGRLSTGTVFCRYEDTHLHEVSRMRALLEKEPMSVTTLCRKLGYVAATRSIERLLIDEANAGRMVQEGSGPASRYRIIKAV